MEATKKTIAMLEQKLAAAKKLERDTLTDKAVMTTVQIGRRSVAIVV